MFFSRGPLSSLARPGLALVDGSPSWCGVAAQIRYPLTARGSLGRRHRVLLHERTFQSRRWYVGGFVEKAWDVTGQARHPPSSGPSESRTRASWTQMRQKVMEASSMGPVECNYSRSTKVILLKKTKKLLSEMIGDEIKGFVISVQLATTCTRN